MKRQGIVLGIYCAIHLTAGCASEPEKEQIQPDKKQSPYILNAITNYNNFKFNSRKADNFNTFRGHSNLYMLGSSDFLLWNDLHAGLFIYETRIGLHASLLLAPQPLINTRQTIYNTSLSGHLLKPVKENFFIDLMGGYGQNKLAYRSLIAPYSITQVSGYANGRSDTWFAILTGLYSRSWDDFAVTGNLSFLHSEIDQQRFAFSFGSLQSVVPQLINKSSFLLENAELAYNLSLGVQPFVNAGLLQVLQFSNSRPVISGVVVGGSLPEFNLDQNGFKLGAGIMFSYKQVALRIEQQYDQRGSVYHSNQTIAALKISIT